jgi:hypothetical protein
MVSREPEGAGYDAHRIDVDGMSLLYRSARLTPRKNGLFVAVWTRSLSGETRPLDAADGIDGAVVHAREGGRSGFFVFPLDVLITRGVFSSAKAPGRRGIRVYPPWTEPGSAQARATMAWQCEWFLTTGGTAGGGADLERARSLHPRR